MARKTPARQSRVQVDEERSETVQVTTKEAIMVELYRGLFYHQQRRLVVGMRALVQANQITRRELGQKPLRGVSDEAVERAFGKIPPPNKKRPPDRDLGDAMGDFLGED